MKKGTTNNNRKTTFGKRKGGKSVKSYNKHHNKSTYKKRQGGRNYA